MSGCNFQTQTEAEHFNLYLVIQVKPAMILWSLNATLLLILRRSSVFIERN